MPESSKTAVVLVHGLWMSRWSLLAIAWNLKKRGFKVYKFKYKTTGKPFNFNIQKFQAYINSLSHETIHIVAHSMGGILSMRSLPGIRKTGKLIMLGSPVNGSQAAKAMNTKWWSKKLLKHAQEPLENGVVNPTVFRQSGMIAGTSNGIGISRFVTRLPEPNDGTVALIETQADWIDEHITVNTNHFRMLFHKQVKSIIRDLLSPTNTNTKL